MKLRLLLLASALFLSLPLLHAEQSQPQTKPDSPLENQMKIMAHDMKQLSLQVANPAKQQETITLLETLKQAATNAKTLEPRKTASVPQADQEKFLADYHEGIDKLVDGFNRVEESVKAGQYDQAQSLLSSIQAIKKENHKEFKQD